MDGAKKDNKKKRDNYSQNAAMKKTPHISYVRNIYVILYNVIRYCFCIYIWVELVCFF